MAEKISPPFPDSLFCRVRLFFFVRKVYKEISQTHAQVGVTGGGQPVRRRTAAVFPEKKPGYEDGFTGNGVIAGRNHLYLR